MIKSNKKTRQWVLLIFCFFSISAYDIDNNRVWKSIGPDGGWLSIVAISRSDPNIVYAINHGGTLLFKSVDGGSQWESVLVDKRDLFGLDDLLVAPGNAQILFALAEANATKRIILRSIDGGIHWSELKLKEGALNNSFFALNTPFSDSLRAIVDLEKGGQSIALSQDGGETWEISETIISSINGLSVAITGIDPVNTKVLYGVPRSVDHGFAGQVAGIEYVLHKSIDGGSTWHSIQPEGDFHASNIRGTLEFQIHPVNSNKLYSGFYRKDKDGSSSDDIVWFSSDDRGENWTSFGKLSETQEINELTLDDNLSNTLYATIRTEKEKNAQHHSGIRTSSFPDDTESEMVVAKSINSGEDWELINLDIVVQNGEEDEEKIVLNSQDNQKILVSSSDGVLSSQNGGLDWQSSNKGLKAIGGKVSVAPDNADVIYLMHSRLRNYKTIDGGKSWERISIPTSRHNCSEIIFNPKNNQEVLCPAYNKIYKSSDGGKSWLLVIDETVLFDEGGVRSIRNLTYTSDGKKVYFFDSGKFISIENNKVRKFSLIEWAQSTGTTGSTSRDIHDFVVDPRNSQVIFLIGEENGSTSVYKSQDGGESWQKKIGAIHDAGKLLLHPLFPDRLIFIDGPTISITGDGGNSWEELDSQVIGTDFDSTAFNPRNKDGFFIGKAKGIFETKNLGQDFNLVDEGYSGPRF